MNAAIVCVNNICWMRNASQSLCDLSQSVTSNLEVFDFKHVMIFSVNIKFPFGGSTYFVSDNILAITLKFSAFKLIVSHCFFFKIN